MYIDKACFHFLWKSSNIFYLLDDYWNMFCLINQIKQKHNYFQLQSIMIVQHWYRFVGIDKR